MTKEQLVSLGLTEEQAQTVAEASVTELKGYVPKADYTALETTKQSLETQLASIEKSVKSLVKDAKGSTLEEKVQDFQTGIETEKANAEKQLHQVKFDYGLEKALAAAKVKDKKDIIGHLELEKIKLNADGTLFGLDEQLAPLKEAKGYLFESAEQQNKGYGGNWPRQSTKNTSPNPWAKETFNLTEQGKMIKENPEQAKILMGEVGVN